MRRSGSNTAQLVCLLLSCGTMAADAASSRAAELLYTGIFTDGNYVTGGHLQEWHDGGAQPKLNGAPIFDAGRPVRWLRLDSGEVSAAPAAFVEFFGGDRLPGRVTDYRSGRESGGRAPPHVLMSPNVTVDFPGQRQRDVVRVNAGDLRRVVWRRRAADRYVPGTLFYADG